MHHLGSWSTYPPSSPHLIHPLPATQMTCFSCGQPCHNDAVCAGLHCSRYFGHPASVYNNWRPYRAYPGRQFYYPGYPLTALFTANICYTARSISNILQPLDQDTSLVSTCPHLTLTQKQKALEIIHQPRAVLKSELRSTEFGAKL